MANIGTVGKTKEILEKYNISAKKNFGQNFIIDQNILNGIVTKGGVTKDVDGSVVKQR